MGLGVDADKPVGVKRQPAIYARRRQGAERPHEGTGGQSRVQHVMSYLCKRSRKQDFSGRAVRTKLCASNRRASSRKAAKQWTPLDFMITVADGEPAVHKAAKTYEVRHNWP